MMKYLQNKRVSTLFISLFTIFQYSCTTVDYEFGKDYIPDSEQMKIQIGTVKGTQMFNITCDSIATSSWRYALLGSIVDPLFGGTNLDFTSTIIPGAFKSQDSLWGDNPKIDSVILSIGVDSRYGDDQQSLNITVRELAKKLPFSKADSIYYSNFNIKPYLSDDVLATFTLKGDQQQTLTKLEPSYAEKFLDTSGMIYLYDTLFMKKFYGLHFETNKLTNRGVVHKVNLLNTYIRIHYHNENKPKADTAYIEMMCNNTANNYNIVITNIDHDYSLADPIVGIKAASINDTVNAQKKIYIQSWSGVMGKVKFNKENFAAILTDAKEKGFSKIAVNNATITFNLNAPTIPKLNEATKALGLMYDYETFNLIKDYYPFDEEGQQERTPNFGGKLNRARECYSMNITGFVQTFFSSNDDIYDLELGPAFGQEQTMNGVVLDGGDINQSAEVSITYTMIK